MIYNKSLKNLLKLGAIILLIVSALGYLQYKDKKNKENSVTMSEPNRINAISNYDAKQNDVDLISGTSTESSEDYAGTGIMLSNRSDFLKNVKSVIDKEISKKSSTSTATDKASNLGIAIANNFIPSCIKYINTVNEDCTDKNIDSYFEQNKNTIYKVFGIDNQENFSDFVSKIKPVGVVQAIEIEPNTIQIDGTTANFKAILKGSNGETELNIKATIDVNTMKANFYID